MYQRLRQAIQCQGQGDLSLICRRQDGGPLQGHHEDQTSQALTYTKYSVNDSRCFYCNYYYFIISGRESLSATCPVGVPGGWATPTPLIMFVITYANY